MKGSKKLNLASLVSALIGVYLLIFSISYFVTPLPQNACGNGALAAIPIGLLGGYLVVPVVISLFTSLTRQWKKKRLLMPLWLIGIGLGIALFVFGFFFVS